MAPSLSNSLKPWLHIIFSNNKSTQHCPFVHCDISHSPTTATWSCEYDVNLNFGGLIFMLLSWTPLLIDRPTFTPLPELSLTGTINLSHKRMKTIHSSQVDLSLTLLAQNTQPISQSLTRSRFFYAALWMEYTGRPLDGMYRPPFGWNIQVALWMENTGRPLDGVYRPSFRWNIQAALWMECTSCTLDGMYKLPFGLIAANCKMISVTTQVARFIRIWASVNFMTSVASLTI
ncbi:hypothetical protein Bpfe_025870 [Biomphalaria pfeifferi]|uniref:Uncharacterized protein n=1 Tax=Biomphalaria pfeifferi TaxID=112525 RepID=A0AAD8AYH3_BIOPF|nr:hypothetical protein Bpfe_025870 [Biomphalaria pfeifferi]